MLTLLFSMTTFASMMRLAVPLLLASMGGLFGDRANILNISLESIMLTGAFFATWGSYLYENPWMGLLFAMAAGILVSALFGLFVLHLHADPVVVGISLNLSAWGFTSLLLVTIFHTRASFMDPRIISFSNFDIPLLGQIPVIGTFFQGQNILTYLAPVLVVICHIVLHHTPFGLRLRGVGINARAAQTIGTSLLRYKWIAVFITGILAGAAGAFLPLSGISLFSENMTAGKGFLAFAAIKIGKGSPLRTALACLVFAYADVISLGQQRINMPSQIVLMLPYLATIIVLALTGKKHFHFSRPATRDSTAV